jgi:hypothetical protein
MALTSALGVGSIVNTTWLQPLAAALLFLLLGVLLARARRCHGYGALYLGLVAGVALYISKFGLNSEVGVYLSGAALVGASIWNAWPLRRAADNTQCHCHTNL